jgi:hypothetical protein
MNTRNLKRFQLHTSRGSKPEVIEIRFTCGILNFYAGAVCSEAVLIVLFVLGRTLREALAQSFMPNDLANSLLSSQNWKIFGV